MIHGVLFAVGRVGLAVVVVEETTVSSITNKYKEAGGAFFEFERVLRQQFASHACNRRSESETAADFDCAEYRTTGTSPKNFNFNFHSQ